MSDWLPHFTLDSTHLLVGWHKDGWKGPHLQWEFGAYINLDFISEKRDCRLTYNYPAWRREARYFQRDLAPLPRFRFTR